MLSGAALSAALASQVVSRPRSGLFFRAMAHRWGHDPLGRQRPIHAQRFNLEGGARVLYLAEDHSTCLQEVQAVGLPFAVTIVPVQVTLRAVIDLGDPATLTALATTHEEWALNFRVRPQPTAAQLLGEACAHSSGAVDGIRYPSLTPSGGLCLAVIEQSLQPGASSLIVNDPRSKLFDQLP